MCQRQKFAIHMTLLGAKKKKKRHRSEAVDFASSDEDGKLSNEKIINFQNTP